MNLNTSALRFGFVVEPYEAKFAGVSIRPLPDYDARRKWYFDTSNADGFFYPPLVSTYELREDGSPERKVPRTTRPAQVFHLLASHELLIEDPVEAALPYTDAALIIQLLAFSFGTRMQFEPWRVDGRIPIKSVAGYYIDDKLRTAFIDHAYSTWKTLNAIQRTRLINLFYVYNRATSVDWDWDSFTQQYMIFDALYKYHVDRQSLKGAESHKQRFMTLCTYYGIPFDSNLVDKLYKARNELFHEAMWVGAMVGYAAADRDAHHFPKHLQRLNARLLYAMTGWRNSFTSSVWWAMGRFLFDERQAVK
jgi:hypothetical protein